MLVSQVAEHELSEFVDSTLEPAWNPLAFVESLEEVQAWNQSAFAAQSIVIALLPDPLEARVGAYKIGFDDAVAVLSCWNLSAVVAPVAAPVPDKPDLATFASSYSAAVEALVPVQSSH